MAFIGNQVTSVPFTTDTFSGNNASTSFGPLTRAPAGSASIAVYISGVYKTPGIDYTVSGTQVTFAVAPASGTNNIVVLHLGSGSATQVPSDGSVTAQKMAVGAVTSSALATGAVQANNILAATITSNLIATGAITGNLIAATSIRGNQIATGTLTGNLFASQTITGDDLADNIIRGNNIVANTITGNLIGQSAISSNNILTNAVTNDKINSVANTKITGLITSAQIAPNAIPASFTSGTLMLFQQTSAPTGWTKQTTHDNKALRVVSGSASSGGSVNFTTAFASQAVSGTVGSTTLTTSQIPSHDHNYFTGGGDGSNGAAGGSASTGRATSATGGGGSHNHTFTGTAINLAVSYVDLIIASKD
jgi:hypothetical protein